jgi:hypothetical protein
MMTSDPGFMKRWRRNLHFLVLDRLGAGDPELVAARDLTSDAPGQSWHNLVDMPFVAGTRRRAYRGQRRSPLEPNCLFAC